MDQSLLALLWARIISLTIHFLQVTFQSVQFCGFQYIHNVAQASLYCPRHFYHSKRNPISIKQLLFISPTPLPFPPQPMTTTNLFPISIDLLILDVS